MLKVVRPYIPLHVRVAVAERQAVTLSPPVSFAGVPLAPMKARLDALLRLLFGARKCELHHRPALVNRAWNKRKRAYDPPANDPRYLVYLLKDEEHRIETYVRGVGAQRSDVSQRRYLKKVAKNREKPIKLALSQRSMRREMAKPLTGRWPPKGCRKLRSRR